MALGSSLFWLVLVAVPSASFSCPEKCTCLQQGNIGSPSFKKIVDCNGKLGDLEGIPRNIPVDTTDL